MLVHYNTRRLYPVFRAADFAGRSYIRRNGRDLECGKRGVVSLGCYAVTLVPEWRIERLLSPCCSARRPSVCLPAEDALANKLRRIGRRRLSHIAAQLAFGCISPSRRSRLCQAVASAASYVSGADTRRQALYAALNPWTAARLGRRDLFRAIRAKQVSVVTDQIETFTETGIRLESGSELEADIIVTATGLNLQVLGGLEVNVDGRTVDFARTLNYKGMMYSDIPNMASAFGYTNASWTLKCDLTCEYVCRLINYMDRHGYKQCVAHNVDPDVTDCRRWISRPATCSARSPNCPSRARSGRGGCIRITRSTSSRCATARSTTG